MKDKHIFDDYGFILRKTHKSARHLGRNFAPDDTGQGEWKMNSHLIPSFHGEPSLSTFSAPQEGLALRRDALKNDNSK